MESPKIKEPTIVKGSTEIGLRKIFWPEERAKEALAQGKCSYDLEDNLLYVSADKATTQLLAALHRKFMGVAPADIYNAKNFYVVKLASTSSAESIEKFIEALNNGEI